MTYSDPDTAYSRNPIKGGMTTEHAAGAIVLAALVALWLIGRGFRGVSFGGASARIG